MKIAAVHHGDGVFDEADGLGADRQGFPSQFTDGFLPEDDPAIPL